MEQAAFSFLPLSVQMNILSMVDSKTQKEMTNSKREKLPKVEFKCGDESKLTILTKDEIEKLNTDGFIVKDNFLGQESLTRYHQNASELFENGKLKQANMGATTENKWTDSSIRSDHLLWLNDIEDKESPKWKETDLTPLLELVNKMKGIQNELNGACNFDSNKTQIQLTCYPGEGARYIRHLDAYVGSSERRITCLYYLNPEYKDANDAKLGGDLRVFHDNSDDQFTDIAPIGDRLVIFQSRLLEHEVLASYFKRFAITVWFY
jgi:SM-20-related protein